MQGVDSKGSAVLGPYKFVSRDQRRMMALFSFSRQRSFNKPPPGGAPVVTVQCVRLSSLTRQYGITSNRASHLWRRAENLLGNVKSVMRGTENPCSVD